MNELETAGLTEVEGRVYEKLLEIGSGSAGIISKKTGIHRRTVYDALGRLISKALVSEIKVNEVNEYVPANPKRLLEILDERRGMLDANSGDTILNSYKGSGLHLTFTRKRIWPN